MIGNELLKASLGELVGRAEPRSREEIETTYKKQRHPAWVYLNGLRSAHSKETMEDRLEQVVRWKGTTIDKFPWAGLEFSEFEAIRVHFSAINAPATTNLTLSAIRGVLRAAWRLGQIPEDRYRRLVDIDGVAGSRLAPGRSLSMEEISRLRAAFIATNTPYGALSRGLLAVFVSAGLRREEVCKLPMTCLDGRNLHVIGKGDKERVVPLAKDPFSDLQAWLDARRALKPTHNFVFIRLISGETCTNPRPITIDAMNRVIKSWARIACGPDFPLRDEDGDKIDPPAITPHDLRRTFISQMLENGADLALVQKLAGHEDPKTTAKYDRRGQRALENAIDTKGVY